MTGRELHRLFLALHNMDRWTLEDEGWITPGKSGDGKWTRFNNNLTTFVLKLSDADRDRLAEMVFGKHEASQ